VAKGAIADAIELLTLAVVAKGAVAVDIAEFLLVTSVEIAVDIAEFLLATSVAIAEFMLAWLAKTPDPPLVTPSKILSVLRSAS